MTRDALLEHLAAEQDNERIRYAELKAILEDDRYTIKKPAGQVYVCHTIEGMHDLVLTYFDNVTGEKYGVVKIKADPDSEEPNQCIAIKESKIGGGVYEKISYMPAQITRALLTNVYTK